LYPPHHGVVLADSPSATVYLPYAEYGSLNPELTQWLNPTTFDSMGGVSIPSTAPSPSNLTVLSWSVNGACVGLAVGGMVFGQPFYGAGAGLVIGPWVGGLLGAY
jgi:hypothetical protein